MDAAIAHKPFSADSYEELGRLTAVLYKVQPTALSYRVVENNHSALLDALARQREGYRTLIADGRSPVNAAWESLVALTQCAINFLAAASAFLDQTRRLLLVEYGDGSKELAAWTEARQHLYDTRFSYRFMYQLRHYAQHYALPLNNLQVHANRTDAAAPWEVELCLSIRRDDLFKDEFNWKHAKEGITSQPDSFDMLPLAGEYLHSLGKLCRSYLDLHSDDIEECERYLTALVSVCRIPPNAWPVVFVGESNVAGCPPGQVEWIPVEQCKAVGGLRRRLPSY